MPASLMHSLRTLIRFASLLAACVATTLSGNQAHAEDHTLITFKTDQLSNTYFSEGASAGDINGDGKPDVACGPYWYEGPDFAKKHEIYKPVPQNTEGYSDNFFEWVHDFNSDGYADIFAVGFCMTPAFVYENPGPGGFDQHWTKHQVIDWVSNESPAFVNLVGDERPELICTRDSFFGFATIDWSKPFSAWDFHEVSAQIAPKQFGHGLGVGDVNGDGRMDILFTDGWFEQPEAHPTTSRWMLHEAKFSQSYGGAEMHAYDVDGDGDNDIITSHAAHDFGLGWYEQVQEDGEIAFKHHLIMGDRPEQNKYGIVFSELHSVALADMDGDGLKDIITGKTYYSHHRQSPMWDADPVVYWFKLARDTDGVDWVPYRAGSTSGIGRQVSIHDVNGDQLPDIVVGGMKGTNVLIQHRQQVDDAAWEAARPKPYVSSGERADRGEQPSFGDDGKVAGAIEAEDMTVTGTEGGSVTVQEMGGFKEGRWSGGKQLFWSKANPRSRLTLTFEVPQSGDYDVCAMFTTAGDYAIINVTLDGESLGQPLDLYDYPAVSTTGELHFGERTLQAGTHKLMLETLGANDSARKLYMVGLDYLRLQPK